MSDHYDQRETLYANGSATKASPIASHLKATTIADMEAAMQKLRGIPPAKWMLIAPDGRVWTEADPLKLAQVIAQESYGLNNTRSKA